MCNEILVSPTSPYGRCLIKVLPQCGVVSGDQANLKLIHSLVEQIIDEVMRLSIARIFFSCNFYGSEFAEARKRYFNFSTSSHVPVCPY